MINLFRNRALVLFALAAVTPAAVFAAPAPSDVAPATVVPSNRILLELTERLRSGECKVGQRIPFRVVDDFAGEGALAIRKGTQALGTVTESRGGGRFGKRGSLKVTIDYTTDSTGRVVPLRLPEGDGKTTRWIATAGSVPGRVVSFFGGGKDVVIEAGARIEALVEGAPVEKKPATVSAQRTLVLKNGDRVTGVIKSRENGVITIVTPLGTLKIPQKDVREEMAVGPAQEAAVLDGPQQEPAPDRFKVLD